MVVGLFQYLSIAGGDFLAKIAQQFNTLVEAVAWQLEFWFQRLVKTFITMINIFRHDAHGRDLLCCKLAHVITIM
jgi:hypothetical protein